MKTIKQWLEELPEPYRTQALNNADEHMLSEDESDLKEALFAAFVWPSTPEGFDYWNKVANGEYYIPEPPKKTNRELAEDIFKIIMDSDGKSISEDINKIETILNENR